VKAVFAGYHSRGESRPWLDHTRHTASPKIVSCLCCTCMISVPLVIMPFPRPPMAGRKDRGRAEGRQGKQLRGNRKQEKEADNR
jgi:hypothetical protein